MGMLLADCATALSGEQLLSGTELIKLKDSSRCTPVIQKISENQSSQKPKPPRMRLQKRRRRPEALRHPNGLTMTACQCCLCERVELWAAQNIFHANREVRQHRDQSLVIRPVVQSR